VSRPHVERLLVLALTASAGVHAALLPAHASEAPLLRAMFVLAALALLGVALPVDRTPEPAAYGAAALLLVSLLAAYAATEFVVLPPLTHDEPVDALGAISKLIELATLVLALCLLPEPRAAQGCCPPYQKELVHDS
jgi:hypothetical protein